MHQELFTGCVENRNDPLKLGRCQVRVVGLHTHDKSILKTEDLPWAYPMQPITSAAMSGLGHSPVGPVEGTWVVIMFRDDDKQQPVILGTIGGIPQAQGSIDQDPDSMILKQDGYLPATDGQTVATNDGTPVSTSTTDIPVAEDTGLKPASSYSASQDAINLIKNWEGKRLTSYQDSAGIWTVGYGTTFINGAPVGPGLTITDAQAEQYLLETLNKNVAPTIKSRVKAPITQSMFDAMCCFTYNVGQGAYSKSTLLKDLNVTQYLNSAGGFLAFNKATVNGVKTVLPGLTNRRIAEKDLFLKDGVPNVSGELTPTQSNAPVDTVAPATSTPSNGLANGGAAMILGFKDPKGKYPLYLNEPDTNKLARHEDIKKTIVFKKEVAREKGVLTAQDKSWDQSKIPYNSQYPFNHVYMTESGHVMEFDDTPNSERVHIYHKTGTFTEIDANGTQVNRIVGDKYEILERNGFIYIKGSADITIDGDHNVRVNNALNLDVHGKTTVNIYNDTVMNVSGKMDLSVKEDLNIKAQNINMEAVDNINIKSASIREQADDMNITAGNYKETTGTSHYRHNGTMYNYIGGDTWTVAESGKTDHSCPTTRSGDNSCGEADSATNADSTGLVAPPDKETPELPEFSDLVVITRGVEAAAHYETPEEGDPSAYIDKRISDGTLIADEVNSGTAQDSAGAAENTIPAGPASCNVIFGMEKFTADLQLSPHFQLGALTKNGSRPVKDQMGLKAAEIVCNLKGLAENCLEPIIKLYPGMVITSGFRSPGDVPLSSDKSRHYYGEAADIIIPGFNREKHYEAIKAIQAIIPYDQLILEYSGSTTVWIHVSFKYTSNRKMAFTMRDHQTYGSMGTYTLIT